MHVLTVLCAGGWMPVNLSEGWRLLGWTVHEFLYGTHMGKDWSAGGLAANRRVNEDLLATAGRLKAEGKLDLLFTVIYDDVLEVETARRLRALDVPMVNYHVDLVGQWYRVLLTAPFFDRLACAQYDHWPALKGAGIRPYYLPMAANPLVEASPERHFQGVLYMGSPWLYRRQVLASIHAAGIPLRVYGHNWIRSESASREKRPDPSKAQPLRKSIHDATHYLLPRMREEGLDGLLDSLRTRLRTHGDRPVGELATEVVMGPYRQETFAALVRGGAINLGFTQFKGVAGTSSERRQLRLRDFEIPISGGFYLTQDCSQLREFFDVDSQVGSWNDEAELLEKCRYYLDHPQERQRMAAAVQAHCLENHTWTRRFSALLDDLRISRSPTSS